MTFRSTPLIFIALIALTGNTQADYEVLLLGNSHSTRNDLAGLIARLIGKAPGAPRARAYAEPHWNFLSERLGDDVSQRILEERDWTHVVLQAQKYSASGRFSYPTKAAEEWIRRVRSIDAQPVMFPEWPLRGDPVEGRKIHDIYSSIAAKEPACVAPVGLVWDLFMLLEPSIKLHDPDGNHSNENGALLTAFVFYEVITGFPASKLPFVTGNHIKKGIQKKMRETASQVIANNPPCPERLTTKNANP